MTLARLCRSALVAAALLTPAYTTARPPVGEEDTVNRVALEPMTAEQLAHHTVRVAGVQITGTWLYPNHFIGDVDPADAVVAYIEKAAADGVDLIAFPELYLGILQPPHPSTDKIAAAARRHGIYVIVGMFETVPKHGTFMNSSMIFDRQGEIVGRYYKSHAAIGEPPYLWPPLPDDPEWVMRDGDDYPVFDLDFGRVGILTCYDGYFPEPWRILGLKGAEIAIWMNARGGAVEDYMVRTHGMANYYHVVANNKAIGAGTQIWAWPDRMLQYVAEPGEAYIHAELQLTPLRNARRHSREFIQRRPAIYRELINHYDISTAYDNMPPLPGAPPPILRLEPVATQSRRRAEPGLTDGTDLHRLGFRITQDWMNGSIEIRLPEILRTLAGPSLDRETMHYIDHYRTTIAPPADPEPFPQWEVKDRITGEIVYTCALPSGVTFAARAWPRRETVDIEFTITNTGTEPIPHAEANMCLHLGGAPGFAERFNIDRLYFSHEGRMTPLSATTPTPQEVGRDPWILLLTRTGKATWKGPWESPTWYLVNEVADRNVMASVSACGKYMVGYAWDTEAPTLMSNCGNPCLHTGPGAVTALGPGESHVLRGRIYVMEKDFDRFLAMVDEDIRRWSTMPRRTAAR